MQKTKVILCLLSVLFVSPPVAVQAFWGEDSGKQSGLNLENGYDANTVTTITGRIKSVQIGDDRRNAQLEVESNGSNVKVILGPQRFWAEKGITLKTGDSVTVRGSKAQGTDGIVYILAQKITDTTQDASVSMRSESGRPDWTGGGMGNGAGQLNNRPAQMRQQSPGRAGGGRMGR
ncbi:MAG: hypothetical protein WCI45_05515 [Desulfuromonadales bacterium]